MSTFRKILPSEFDENVFNLIGKDWMLLASEVNGAANAMTASWGGLGIMWGKPVAYVVIRPQRYTKEFVDVSERLSLSFFDNSFRKTLNYFGTVSGRDEDKITNSGLKLVHNAAVPYFEEARLVLICKNLFRQDFDKNSFLNTELINIWYPKNDFHSLYIAEIEAILKK